jgi:hypothetical protein
MAKETKLGFSSEHTGSTTGKPEVDTHRSSSDKGGTEKVGHNEVSPGYGKDAVKISINKK